MHNLVLLILTYLFKILGTTDPSSKKSSVSSVNLGSSLNIFEQEHHKDEQRKPVVDFKSDTKQQHQLLLTIIEYFDLSLLAEPNFLIILASNSLFTLSETNFSMLAAFILGDIGLDNFRIATYMSVVATVDMAMRFVVPFAADYYKRSPKVMCCICMAMTVTARQGKYKYCVYIPEVQRRMQCNFQANF